MALSTGVEWVTHGHRFLGSALYPTGTACVCEGPIAGEGEADSVPGTQGRTRHLSIQPHR